MKIIFVHFNNGYSGSPKVLQTVIEAINHKELLLVTNQTEGFLSGLNLKKITYKFNLSNSSFKTLIRYFIAQTSSFFKVLKHCNKGDILYVNTTIPIFAAFAGKIKGAKIIFHLHESKSSLNIVHRTLARFRPYVSQTEIFVSKYLYHEEHISNKKNYILYNVVSQKFFDAAKFHKTLFHTEQNRAFNILMICSLKKYKGVFEFLKIAKALINYSNIEFTLLVSEEKNEINAFFNEIEIPLNVSVHSKTNDPIPFYKKASMLLNLSRPDEWIETYGLTILEGMVFGLPCIVPPIGGPVELVDDEVNGFKISVYEEEKIIKTILRIYNDKNLFVNMSNNSRKRSLNYSFQSFQKELNMIINSII